MALRNIGAANSGDAFYRYKMPTMVTKIEGRGNGIKTNVAKMVEIAKALDRPASYIIKYFGCELGAQSKFDEKTGVSLVNGKHEQSTLEGLLEKFIKKYVQCYECGNPETQIIITKTQTLRLKCAACGFVSDVDMKDKLTTFILKNPPEQKKAMKKVEEKKLKEGKVVDEALKKLKKKGATKDGAVKGVGAKKKPVSDDDNNSPSGSQTDDDDDVQWQTDTSVEAARRRMQEQLSVATAEMVMLSTAEPGHKKAKPDNKTGAVAKNGSIEQTIKMVDTKNGNPHDKLVEVIKETLQKGTTARQMHTFLSSLDATPEEIVTSLFDALFQGVGKGLSEEVTRKKNYLAAVVQEEGMQTVLLKAIDNFCRKSRPETVREVALVLKALYDANILEEKYIVKWYENGLAGENKNSQIWKNTKPFVEWLQTAESESEEE